MLGSAPPARRLLLLCPVGSAAAHRSALLLLPGRRVAVPKLCFASSDGRRFAVPKCRSTLPAGATSLPKEGDSTCRDPPQHTEMRCFVSHGRRFAVPKRRSALPGGFHRCSPRCTAASPVGSPHSTRRLNSRCPVGSAAAHRGELQLLPGWEWRRERNALRHCPFGAKVGSVVSSYSAASR
jgi:hypothetical protein